MTSGPDRQSAPASAMRLEGIESRVAVVTGASSGIGLRIGQVLTELGARVAGVDLSPAAGEFALSCQADVSDQQSVDGCFSRIETELGTPQILVTSAGVFQPATIDLLDADLWRRTIDINLTGTFLCVQRALPGMRRQGFGRVVTISSAAGIDGGDTACSHYAASKAGVNVLSKAVSKEVAGDGVTVNVVAPRNVRTPMIAGLEAELEAAAPVGRLGTPDDVAAAVAYLCSDHASYVTGEVFALTGGAL